MRIPLLAVLVLAGAARAAEPFSFSLYVENDSGLLKPNDNADRHYTHGMAVSFAWQPQWAQDLAECLGGGTGAAGFTAGQLMFTPRDIETPSLDPDEPPYAGYLYAGMFWQRERDNVLDHLQLDLGYVGPESGAEDVQKWWHERSGADRPEGWSHQLEDEVTAQFYYRRKWRLSITDPTQALGVQLIPYAGLAVGTVYRHLEGGATLRIGWNLPDDFGPGRLADLASATGDRPGQECVSFYGFVRAGGRVVEHNLFIEGSEFRDSPGVSPEPLYGELQAGLALTLRLCDTCALDTTYSQTFMTHQFMGQDESDGYGALTLSFLCLF